MTGVIRGCVKDKRANLKTKVTRKQSTPNFPKNEHYTYVCVSGGKKCLFFKKIGVLCFLVTSVLRFALLSLTQPPITPVALFPYHRQI